MKKVTDGQKLKLALTLVENTSWDKLDGDAIQGLILDPAGTGKKATEWLTNGGNLQVIVGNYTVDLDADPFIPEGWKVEEHRRGGQFIYDPTKVELYLSDEQKSGTIQGHKLRKLLEAKNSMNANMLEFYLKHPELIPESWKGKAVFFWGTIYRYSDGNLCVRYLYWSGGRWRWNHSYWLDNDWNSGSPALVACK